MRLRIPLLAALAAIVAAFAVTAATASAAPTTGITAPISTTTAAGDVLSGTLQITSFTASNGQLVANGIFNGSVKNAVTGVVTPLEQTLTNIAVSNTSTSGGCQILDLTLGPLNLNVLGLVVTLNQVHLNITAQPGPGNLLGNLLCSVSHLLDNGNSNAIQNLLNLLNGLL